MKIAHYKQSPIAMVPEELTKAIHKYTEHKSLIINRQPISSIPNDVDIVHFHNRGSVVNKPSVIQYHSEPHMVDLNFNANKKLVVSQYQSTLPEYSHCKIVRNLINFDDKIYSYKEVKDKIKIGYAPTRKRKQLNTTWHDKGYEQTTEILNKLKKTYPKVIDFDVITDVSLDECIRRKNECNIIIDECVTGSFHRSGLEGLALGKLTICGISDKVKEILKKVSGSPINPFYNIMIGGLYNELCKLIDTGIDYINKIGYENIDWMKQYWEPETIVNEYIKIYLDVLNKK